MFPTVWWPTYVQAITLWYGFQLGDLGHCDAGVASLCGAGVGLGFPNSTLWDILWTNGSHQGWMACFWTGIESHAALLLFIAQNLQPPKALKQASRYPMICCLGPINSRPQYGAINFAGSHKKDFVTGNPQKMVYQMMPYMFGGRWYLGWPCCPAFWCGVGFSEYGFDLKHWVFECALLCGQPGTGQWPHLCAGLFHICFHDPYLSSVVFAGVKLLVCFYHYPTFSGGSGFERVPPWFETLFSLSFPATPRSRGSTWRSKVNPLGRRDSVAVQVGNLLCARALVLILIIAAKGCFWVLEQPGTSVMELHPLFQALLRLLPGVVKKTINMSSFGAPTKKRTLLYSSNFAFKNPFGDWTMYTMYKLPVFSHYHTL